MVRQLSNWTQHTVEPTKIILKSNYKDNVDKLLIQYQKQLNFTKIK